MRMLGRFIFTRGNSAAKDTVTSYVALYLPRQELCLLCFYK